MANESQSIALEDVEFDLTYKYIKYIVSYLWSFSSSGFLLFRLGPLDCRNCNE